jgi:membrane protein YqaA with SNARE-associated domain
MLDPIYLTIAKDSFFGNFGPTVSGEFAYKVALSFGTYNNILASVAAFIGSVGGLFATYGLFYALAVILKEVLDRNPGYPQARHYISKFAPVFGIIMMMPQICVIPPFFFGFGKMNWKRFLMVLVFYRVMYYIFMLYATAHHG